MSVLICILISFLYYFLHNKSILWYYSIIHNFEVFYLTKTGGREEREVHI